MYITDSTMNTVIYNEMHCQYKKKLDCNADEILEWPTKNIYKNCSYPYLDKQIDLPRLESKGKGFAVIGNPRTRWTDSLVSEMTLPPKTISPDL